MNFHDMQRYLRQSVENLVPPEYYLHRKAPLPEKTLERISNFQDQVSTQLLDTIRLPSGKQFVLRGLASEGKTTEIRRLAYSIQQQLDSPRQGISTKASVHLLSMQNYSGIGANISTVDDLWGLLISCHQARNIARQRMNFDDFSQLHAQSGHRPILLIDTLDMLAYGRKQDDVGNVTKIWAELVERMNEAKMTVLWSVRPNEIALGRWVKPLGLTLIDLPQLAWDESLSLARKFVGELNFKGSKKPPIDFQVFTALLLVQYPILAKYMKSGKGRSGSLRGPLYRVLSEMFDDFSESKAYQNAHPLDWVMKKEHANRSKNMVKFEAPRGNFVIDELYKLSRSEILQAMHVISHTPEEVLEEVWYNHIEVKMFDEIEVQSSDFTNRLWLPKTLDDGYGETGRVYEYLMMIGSDGDDAYGLFSIEGDRVCFQHQLFAEYAVYRAAWSEYEGDVHDTAAVQIPSCRLRMRSYPLDDAAEPDDQVAEFMKWFKPFFTINRDLQSLPDTAPQLISDSDAWNTARGYALDYKAFKDHQTNAKTEDDLFSKASDDKRHILKKHEMSVEPLSINGPAGTGKSYIANPFIYAFVNRSRRSGDLNEGQKPMVKFVTLSKDLAAGFVRDHQEFMDGRELPIQLGAQPVDELLMDLTAMVFGRPSHHLKDFSKHILTENKFVFTLSNDNEFLRHFRGFSVQSLWHEFLDCIIDEKGNEIGLTNYLDDSSVYSYSQLADREKRSAFYQTLQRLDLLNPNRTKTRRKIASDIIDALEKILLQGENLSEATSLMERLKPYRTDVLLVDEVQDLGSAVLKLCFILHQGKQGDVAILGDREQTLELHQFDWTREFQIIGKSLYDMALSASQSNFGDLLGLEKWNHRLGGSDLSNSVKDRLEYFHEVHRNVPPIVDLMRWSFQNAAKTSEIEHLFSIPEGGTASITTNQKRVNDYEEWKKQFLAGREAARAEGTLPWGVFYLGSVDGVPSKISLSELIKVIEIASYSDDPIEIILPDEHHRKLIATELSDQDIQQTIWDPVTIKGLENKTIIAVSPWSIHNERLTQYVRAEPTSSWDEMVSSVSPRNRPDFVKIVEQRRRHANVMLSRPKDTLFILTLDSENEDNVSLTDTTEPDFEAIIDDKNIANIMAEIDTLEELRTYLEGPDAQGSLRDPSRHMALLEKLIQQSRGLDQIGIKSSQVHNIARDRLEQDPEKYQFMFSKFILISDYCKGVAADSAATVGVSYIKKMLFDAKYRSHDLMKYRNKSITPLQAAFDDWQLLFYKLSDLFVFVDDGKPRLEYSTDAYDQLVSLFNAFVQEISGFQDDPEYERFEAIRNFVFEDIFGGRIDTSAYLIWFERARKMSLRVMEMVHILGDDSNQNHRIDELLDLMALFKKEYYRALVDDVSTNEKQANWSGILRSRGYDEDSTSRDPLTKLRPYHDGQLSDLRGTIGAENDSQRSAFWGDGIQFLKFNEFEPEQLNLLENKFFRLLSWNNGPADEHPWLDDQLLWLLHLLVNAIERTDDATSGLVRLLDLERYGIVRDLAHDRFSIEPMIAGDVAKSLWDKLQMGEGQIDRAWSNMLRMNHFHLYSVVQDYVVKPETGKHHSDVIKMERFYQTAGLLASLDHPSDMHPSVVADLEQKINLMSEFVGESSFLDLSSIAVNSTTIMRYYNAPAEGLLGELLTNAFANLGADEKGHVLQHVLGVYIGAHGRQDNSLRSIFREEKSMGLLPQTSVKEYIREHIGGDKKMFGQIINQLFPVHSLRERGEPYYPVHINIAYMETPTMVYDTDGLIRPESLKNQRNSWLKESLEFAFIEELCDLNHVESNTIYTLGLNEFAQLVTYLPRAPTRFGTFQDVWGRDLDIKQIHQQYVRFFLNKFIDKLEWLNSNYELIDKANNRDNIRIFLGGLNGIGIQLELDRYLQFERFSRFLRAHISDLSVFSERDMYQREVVAFGELFNVNSLIRQLVDAWIEGEGESAALSTIIKRFWENIRIAVPPNIDVELPASIDDLFNGCDCNYAYSKVLGNADEFYGFYGAARNLLTMFGGTTEAFGKTQIKAYKDGEVAPGSGTGEIVIGARVYPAFQRVVLSQINYLEWSAESAKPMAELNRLSKAGEITWYNGFTITDLGQRPFDATGHDEEE